MTRSNGATGLALVPISPQRIFQEVADQLRRTISEGRLKPGDKLPPEREMARMFGVSRNTMREALRALELSGLIELKLGATGGAFVLPGSSNAVVNGMRDLYFLGAVSPDHLTQARIAISEAVIRMAVPRLTDARIAELEANVAAAERAHKAGNFEERTRYHQEFHVMLARATDNPLLLATAEGVMEVARQFIKAIGPTNEQNYTLPSRKRLLTHLKNRDVDKAVKEMTSALRKLHQDYMVRARVLTPGEAVARAAVGVKVKKTTGAKKATRQPSRQATRKTPAKARRTE